MVPTNIAVILSAIFILLLILDLVRRRQLREEYSWLWLGAALIYLLIAIWPGLSRWFARLLGVKNIVSAYVFLGFLFILVLCIQFSTRLSRLTTRLKNLSQEIAILESEIRRLTQNQDDKKQKGEESQSLDQGGAP